MMISVKTFMHQKQTLAKISGPEIIFAETHTRAPPPPNPPLEFRKCGVGKWGGVKRGGGWGDEGGWG